jgi:hypothetical protein
VKSERFVINEPNQRGARNGLQKITFRPDVLLPAKV